ncbi:hypothetical protein [Mesorhizobium erdmanii]|uniref:hypothetical protein n=1 Tax=Mesorhizobium erdmanii TaxID=1777866 RepID=UPI002FF9FD91
MLQTVAEALGEDFRERLVFVGGCTTALFITDEVTLEDVRATDDVDLIVDLAGYGEWAQLREELRQRGFAESPEDNVICRMRLRDLKVDFMPDDAGILGFTNHWYAAGIETAVTHELTDTLRIKKLSPELFVATKLEAYLGRGAGDLFMSRDMEDILLIVDGGRRSWTRFLLQRPKSTGSSPNSSQSCFRTATSNISLREMSAARQGGPT